MTTPIELGQNKKSGFVTIIGLPNAGKSTLVELLFGQRLSIISPKAQTTRYALKAIYNDDDTQIIFIDTPGIVVEKSYLMHEKMMQEVSHASEAADVYIFMVDVHRMREDTIEVLRPWLNQQKPHITLLNKTDIGNKSTTETITEQLKTAGFQQILPFCAKREADKEKLLKVIKPMLPHDHSFYEDQEQLSDRNLKFFCSEFIREQLYYFLQAELPYETAVTIHEFKEKENVTVIYADIVVSKQSQKGILIGEGGKMIQDIGTAARKSIEEFLDRKVYLQLRVRVRENWRKKPHFLKEYGFKGQ